MTNSDIQEPEGTTLNVYSFVVKKGEPVGPREVMRGVNLSSPSVAYWHLQKLESSGLLQKNRNGEYIVREKTSISGHVWIGRNLVPRLMFYSLFFFEYHSF
jgi:predicted transcriptional regulator